MKKRYYTIDNIPNSELFKHPLWEFALDREEEQGETAIRPVKRLPVDSLTNKVAVVSVTLAGGMICKAMLSNVDLQNKRKTEQFITLSVESEGKWFHLARYFDGDENHSSDNLARFLNLHTNLVFPVSYDLTGIAIGLEDVVKGQIPRVPKEILSSDERMKLLFS